MILYIKKIFLTSLNRVSFVIFELNITKENIVSSNLQIVKELNFTLYREL